MGVLISLGMANGVNAWWNSSFLYRKNIIIYNDNNPNNLYNYQVPINLTYLTGMQADFRDVRYIDSDDSAELYAWNETQEASSWSYDWVKIPYIPASSSKVIYAYYGNAVASQYWNPNNTFELFDDFAAFNNTKWLEPPAAAAYCNRTINEGELWLNCGQQKGFYWYVNSSAIFPTNRSMVFSGVVNNQSSADDHIDTMAGWGAGKTGPYNGLQSNYAGFDTYTTGAGSNHTFVSNNTNSYRTASAMQFGEPNKRYEIKRNDSYIEFWHQYDFYRANASMNSSAQPISFYIATETGVGTSPAVDFSQRIDYVFVRNYSQPEPTTSTSVSINNCSSSTSQFLNMSIKDEGNKTDVYATVEIALNLYDNDGSSLGDYSFIMYGDNNYSLCFSPSTLSFIGDVHIQYYNRTSYPDRTYFLNNVTLSNSTTASDLYSISAGDSSAVTINVKDSGGAAQPDVYVYAQRYYVSENSYITTSISKTDSEGKAGMYLAMNDVWYKFILVKNGAVIQTINPMTIKSTDITFTLSGVGYIEYFNYYEKVGKGCSFNNATGVLSCTAVDTSGILHKTCLKVGRLSSMIDNITCDYCTSYSSPSSTMTCTIGNITGQAWYYTFYGSFNESQIFISDILDYTIADEKPYGADGILVSALMIMIISAVGIWSPHAAILLALTALTMSAVMGFVALSAGAWVSIIVVGMIFIFKLRS